MKKWYTGLDSQTIAGGMEQLAQVVLLHAWKNETDKAEELYQKFINQLEEVTPAIVDTKTEFYLHNKNVYNAWNECMERLHNAKQDMDSKLPHILKAVKAD